MFKYKYTFEIIDVTPPSMGNRVGTFTVWKYRRVWPWYEPKAFVQEVKESLPPFGVWSDVRLISITRI